MKIIAFIYSYLATLHCDKKGASAIEYAVIAGIIAALLIVAVTALGGGIDTMFDNIVSALSGLSFTP